MTAQLGPIVVADDGYTATCCRANTPVGVAGTGGITGTASGACTLARRGKYRRLGSCSVTSNDTGAGHVPEGINSSVCASNPGPLKMMYVPLRLAFTFHCGALTGIAGITELPVIASTQTNVPKMRRSTDSITGNLHSEA